MFNNFYSYVLLQRRDILIFRKYSNVQKLLIIFWLPVSILSSSSTKKILQNFLRPIFDTRPQRQRSGFGQLLYPVMPPNRWYWQPNLNAAVEFHNPFSFRFVSFYTHLLFVPFNISCFWWEVSISWISFISVVEWILFGLTEFYLGLLRKYYSCGFRFTPNNAPPNWPVYENGQWRIGVSLDLNPKRLL